MMTTTQCPSTDHLKAYTLGRLGEIETDELFQHLKDCDACKADLETIDDGDDSLVKDLRADDQFTDIFDEPDCKIAMAKALATLAAQSPESGSDDFSVVGSDLQGKIGEYEIVRPIGRGGMGSVYLARHTKLEREVAVKVLASHRLADPRMRSRFDAEMQAIGRLSHPNIVTAHDAREVEGTAVLITEYIDGFDLAELVRRNGALSISDACEIVRKIAAALQYISDQGFVHRDVKPSNIMLSNDGEAKLLDLGLARYESGNSLDLTGTGQAIGTPDYVAPEQVNDGRNVDGRSDVYSLGCTLFTMLTGKPPFSDAGHQTAFAKMTAHVSDTPPMLADRMQGCPPALSRLVESMLAKDPQRRPQSCGEVATKMASWASGNDLKELVRTVKDRPDLSADDEVVTVQSETQWHRRPVPVTVAIATGLLGILIGVMMGLFIKITYRDGTVVQFPITGANVEVVDDDATKPVQSASPMSIESLDPNAVPSAGNSALNSLEERQSVQGRVGSNRRSRRPPAAPPTNGVWKLVAYEHSDQIPPTEMLLAFNTTEFYGVVRAYDGRHEMSVGRIRGMQVQHDRVSIMTVDSITEKALNVTCHFTGPDTAVFEFDPFKMPEEMPFQGSRQNIGRRQVNYVMKRIGDLPMSADQRSIYLDGGHRGALGLSMIEQVRTVGVQEYVEMRRKVVQTQSVTESRNNLKHLALAFHNYHDNYGKFPASSNRSQKATDAGETKPYSWRVAVLPYLGEMTLYEQYKFDEDWDSESNQKILAKMPKVFRSPHAGGDQPTSHTNYLGYATGKSALGIDEGVKMRDIRDGTSNTLLLIETKDSVPWTKPQDLDGEASFFDPVMYAMADGSIHGTSGLDPGTLKKMISRDDGQPVKRQP